MKKLLLSSLILLTACTSAPSTPSEPTTGLETPVDGIYTLFTINTHDHVFPDKSAETIGRIIDIHEEYDVPVDIYLDDQIFQLYLTDYPELIERLKSSPVVTVGYHIRPPYPYYIRFDFAGLADLSEEELYDVIMDYETHKIDLETGEITDEPGGFAYMSEVMGYPLPIAATSNTANFAKETSAQIYKELGATFTVEHGREIDLGEQFEGLYLRPEHIDYKLYEKAGKFSTGEEAFSDAIAQAAGEGMRFIGMKFHEDNFYCEGTPYWPIYFKDQTKQVSLKPPFDLSAPEGVVKLRTEEERDARWTLYESTVKYAADHRDDVHPVSVRDLEELM